MSEKNQPNENPTVKVTVVEIPVTELTALRDENATLKAKIAEAVKNATIYESLYSTSQKDINSLNARIEAIKKVLAI